MESIKFHRFFRASFALVLAICGPLVIAPDVFSKARSCDLTPTGVETEDYWLDFVTESMPDDNLNGLPAQIRVHRVKPVYANGKCRGVPNLAAVLVHGRSAASTATFDVRFPGLQSNQELLAKAGIDTFAPDLLGYGYSSRLSLNDPCNASYPGYNADETCSFEHCDRSPNPGVGFLDQQRKPAPNPNLIPPVGIGDGVRVNPFNSPEGALCEHSSNAHFANNDVWARDIIHVIDSAIEKAQPRGNKVVLIGYSLGGIRVARTLYLLGAEAERRVRRVVFWASTYNRAPGPGGTVPDTMPTEESDPSVVFPTFPLTLGTVGGIGGSLRDNFCTGRILPGLDEAFKQQFRGQEDPTQDPRYPDGDWQELFGLEWGGNVLGNPTGLLALPTFTRYGWNPEVAATFTLPTLVLNGIDDPAVRVVNSTNIFHDLTQVTHKVLVQVGCGSHSMQADTCGGSGCADADPATPCRCDDGDPNTIPYGQNTQMWEGPHRTVAAAITEWIKYGSFDGSECGHFIVNESGVASEVETPECPEPPEDPDFREKFREFIRHLLEALRGRH